MTMEFCPTLPRIDGVGRVRLRVTLIRRITRRRVTLICRARRGARGHALLVVIGIPLIDAVLGGRRIGGAKSGTGDRSARRPNAGAAAAPDRRAQRGTE